MWSERKGRVTVAGRNEEVKRDSGVVERNIYENDIYY